MAELLLRCADVWFAYDDASPVLRAIDLEIGRGEAIALVGQNGSGKTTLAKHMNGLLHPNRGQIILDGHDTRETTAGELASIAGYVFQNPDHQIFSPSVEREIAFGPENLGLSGDALRERIEQAIDRFGLSDVRDRHPTLLGRGLRRRVAIASVYALGPSLMILDEPTGGLDRRLAAELIRLLRKLVDEGRTVILISHDMRLVGEFAERLIVMHEGEIIGDGLARDLLPDPKLMQRARLHPPEVTILAQELAEHSIQPAVRLDEFRRDFRKVYEQRFSGHVRGAREP